MGGGFKWNVQRGIVKAQQHGPELSVTSYTLLNRKVCNISDFLIWHNSMCYTYSQYVQSVKSMYIEEWDVYHCIIIMCYSLYIGKQMGIEISRDL